MAFWSRKKSPYTPIPHEELVKRAQALAPPKPEPRLHKFRVADWTIYFHSSRSEPVTVVGTKVETGERDTCIGELRQGMIRITDRHPSNGDPYTVAVFDRHAVGAVVSSNWRVEDRGTW